MRPPHSVSAASSLLVGFPTSILLRGVALLAHFRHWLEALNNWGAACGVLAFLCACLRASKLPTAFSTAAKLRGPVLTLAGYFAAPARLAGGSRVCGIRQWVRWARWERSWVCCRTITCVSTCYTAVLRRNHLGTCKSAACTGSALHPILAMKADVLLFLFRQPTRRATQRDHTKPWTHCGEGLEHCVDEGTNVLHLPHHPNHLLTL